MSYTLGFIAPKEMQAVELPASKSIANRLLIMQALSGNGFDIENLSEAEDTHLLQAALKSNQSKINVGMAGTAYRFLTAYYGLTATDIVLDGAERMHKRPIKILVDVLKQMGVDIAYLEKEGFPPLRIKGKTIVGGQLEIDGSISSQYISAILLIAPYMKEGLSILLTGRVVSLPYIDMTIKLMNLGGAIVERDENRLNISFGGYKLNSSIKVEADWSAAAFFYQMVALSGISIVLNDLQLESIQGDKQTALHFEKLGVKSVQTEEGVLLSQIPFNTKSASFDLIDCPDLIPAIVATASQLVDHTIIKGATTLRIKESNRVEALQAELAKVSAKLVDLEEDVFEVFKSDGVIRNPCFETHNDHRMAMCLAPLVCAYPDVRIMNPEVVDKSFPNFWKELRKVGVVINLSSIIL